MTAEDLARGCHRALQARGASVATAESLTGGLVGAALTSMAGSSSTYRGGVVAYALDLKVSVLGVPAALLDRHGPVHPDVALAMADGARDRLGATFGLSTTGVAGPEAHGGQAPGTVDLACVGPGVRLHRRLGLPGDRSAIRAGTVEAALTLLLAALDHPPTDPQGSERTPPPVRP